jgi:hypothetical protein
MEKITKYYLDKMVKENTQEIIFEGFDELNDRKFVRDIHFSDKFNHFLVREIILVRENVNVDSTSFINKSCFGNADYEKDENNNYIVKELWLNNFHTQKWLPTKQVNTPYQKLNEFFNSWLNNSGLSEVKINDKTSKMFDKLGLDYSFEREYKLLPMTIKVGDVYFKPWYLEEVVKILNTIDGWNLKCKCLYTDDDHSVNVYYIFGEIDGECVVYHITTYC